MNHRVIGIEQLFNDEDKLKITGMQSEIRNLLEDITNEDNDQYGYVTSKIANKFGSLISDEMKSFSIKLFEKKRKVGLPQTEISELSLQGKDQNQEKVVQHKKDDKDKHDFSKAEDILAMKHEWVKLKRSIKSINDLHPLSINIELIHNLPCDIYVKDEDEENEFIDQNQQMKPKVPTRKTAE